MRTMGWIAIVACLVVAGPAAAQSSAEVERWVAELGHEDYARREAATALLLDAGEAGRRALALALEAPASLDPEVRRRIESILADLDWRAEWEAGGLEPARRFLAGFAPARCSCGNAEPWEGRRIDGPALERWFPATRFFRFDWACCSDGEFEPVLIAISRAFGGAKDFALDGQGMAALAHHARPALDESDLAALGGAIASLLDHVLAGDRIVVPEPRPAEVVPDGRGWAARVEGYRHAWNFRFGPDRRLVECSRDVVFRQPLGTPGG